MHPMRKKQIIEKRNISDEAGDCSRISRVPRSATDCVATMVINQAPRRPYGMPGWFRLMVIAVKDREVMTNHSMKENIHRYRRAEYSLYWIINSEPITLVAAMSVKNPGPLL